MKVFIVFLGLTIGSALFQFFAETPNWSLVVRSSIDYATALFMYTLIPK